MQKKILYVHHGSVLGGAPTSLKYLLEGLRRSGDFRLKVLCVYPSMVPFFQSVPEVEVARIAIRHLALGRLLIGLESLTNWRSLARGLLELVGLPLSVRRQAQVIRREQPDVVHLNSAVLLSTAIAARLCGVPLVWHVREVVQGSRWNPRRWLAGRVIRCLADRVIAISEAEAASLGSDREGKVVVIYNSLDLEEFSESAVSDRGDVSRLQLEGLSPDEPFVVSLGGAVFRKGPVELVEAARHLSNRVTIAIAGMPPRVTATRGPSRWLCAASLWTENLLRQFRLKAYYSWCYQTRLSSALRAASGARVSFLGMVTDVPGLIARSTAVIFAGTTPHFARPIYEAWAMKKPVIVFDTHGIQEQVDDQVDGLVVRDKTGRGLARAIETILADSVRARAMGENGYKKVVARFDMMSNAQKVNALYRSLIGEVSEIHEQ